MLYIKCYFQLAEKSHAPYCSSCEARLKQNTHSMAPVAVETSGLHTEHVLSEGCGQGEPMYEDIVPHMKDEGGIIELEMNVAYKTTTITK